MIQVERFINELMTSNCYVIYDKQCRGCVIVDPASEKCEEVIDFVEKHGFIPQYVILTHEHTDHTWGCNTLIERYNPKVVCSEACKEALPREGRAYFQFYYDNPEYTYAVSRVYKTVEELKNGLDWNGFLFHFIHTPGHSDGSVCFSIENMLFTGDTIMQYKPFIPRKRGSLEQFHESVKLIMDSFDGNIIVYPGHGERFMLSEYGAR